MIMADVFKFLFLILGTQIILVGYWLLFEGLCGGLVARAQHALQARPWRSLGWGLGLSIPAVAAGLALLNAPAQAKLAGFIVLGAWLLLGLFGSAGLARLIGEGLPGGLDATQPWRRVLRGGIVLSITFVLPLVGWLFIMPLALALGVGALAASRGAARAAAKAQAEAPSADMAEA